MQIEAAMLLGSCDVEQGRAVEGRAAVLAGFAEFIASGERILEHELHRLLGECLLADGALPDGKARAEKLLASCGLHGIEPWTYLRDLLCLLPSWPKSRVLELAPVNWKQTLEQQDAQQRLDANPFRTAIIALQRAHPDIQ